MNISTPYIKENNNDENYIPLAKPSITKKEIDYVNEAMINGWGENKSKFIEKFEIAFAKKTGAKFALATSSCTGALHLGLESLGIKKGDEVIVPESTWIASVAPIVHLGAKPVFVDILKDSWCIDPKLVEAAITPKTRAILCVHLYGNLCELSELIKICQKFNISLIEDSAEAFGSKYFSKHVGTFGSFGVFSFHGSKTISTGEGGMLITNDRKIYEKVKVLNNHGINRNFDKQYCPSLLGYKFKITNVQAAMGLAQIERSKEIIQKKIKIMKFYKDYFYNNKLISFNIEPYGYKNSFWMPTAVFSSFCKVNIPSLINEFQDNNIDARSFFCPLSSLKFFKENKKNKISRDIYSRAINLPSFYDINENQLLKVCRIIENTILKK